MVRMATTIIIATVSVVLSSLNPAITAIYYCIVWSEFKLISLGVGNAHPKGGI